VFPFISPGLFGGGEVWPLAPYKLMNGANPWLNALHALSSHLGALLCFFNFPSQLFDWFQNIWHIKGSWGLKVFKGILKECNP
jgi:hypothetical protein